MSISNGLHKIEVKLNRPMPEAKLTLVGPDLKKIESLTFDSLSMELPTGIYQVRIDAPGYYQEEYIKAEKDETFIIELKTLSAIPAFSYKSTHEYYSEPAEKYSRSCTQNPSEQCKPDFFFFLARYEKERTQGGTLPYAQFSFSNESDLNIKFDTSNTYYDQATGLAIFSGNFDEGLYFLTYEAEADSRIIPIYVFKGFQTQFFVRFAQTPDFLSSRLFFNEQMQFDRMNKVYPALERLLLAFSNYAYYKTLSTDEENVIKGSPYLSTLANILHLAIGESLPYDESVLFLLPDTFYLTDGVSHDLLKSGSLSDLPPILSFVMYKYSGNPSRYIEAASIMDRIAEHLKYDIFWSSFIQIAPRKKIVSAIKKATNKLTGLGWFRDLVAPQQMNDLDKRVEGFKRQKADAEAIAKKLNVPLTTVTRNYTKLKSAYEAIIQSERELEKNVFFKK